MLRGRRTRPPPARQVGAEHESLTGTVRNIGYGLVAPTELSTGQLAVLFRLEAGAVVE